jgi:hypothetical protein
MKTLYDTIENHVKDYPRADDEAVVGLDPRYLILDVIETPPPELAENETAVRVADVIDLDALTLTRAWRINTLPPPPDYKIWMNVQEFMAEFSMAEKADIALSSDPTLAALRLDLSTWLSTVHANDPRVLMGLDKLAELNIITAERKQEILN